MPPCRYLRPGLQRSGPRATAAMMTIRRPKLLLVYPPITPRERYSSAIGASGGRQIPLGIYYLAAFTGRHGFKTDVIDAEATQQTNAQIIDRLHAGGFNVLGISSTTVAFHRALALAQAVKAASPETVVVIGGPHVSSQPTHPLEWHAFDFAVRNEGELTLVELLEALAGRRPLEAIAGLVYRSDTGVVVNPKRPFIQDLDALPFPAYDRIDDLTRYTPPPCNYKASPVANVITSRGCPSRCTFCDTNTFGRRVRFRSAENVAAEIEHLSRAYGVREIAFVDDTFTLRRQRIVDLFQRTRAMGLRFPWTCMARIDTVDEALLQTMRANGCWHISFGIESGDADILKIIRKDIDLSATRRVIAACRRLGILTKGFFIIGHPAETPATIEATIRLALNLDLDDVVVTINTPIPGSEQFDRAAQYGTLDISDWSKYNYWNPVFVPHGMSREVLTAKHREFYRRFYLRPHILWRYAKSFCSPTGLRRLAAIAASARFLLPETRTHSAPQPPVE